MVNNWNLIKFKRIFKNFRFYLVLYRVLLIMDLLLTLDLHKEKVFY
jgi:hypothetical protein